MLSVEASGTDNPQLHGLTCNFRYAQQWLMGDVGLLLLLCVVFIIVFKCLAL